MADPNLSSLIWSVADLLRGDYKQSEYGKVILPFTVLRRLDCVLEKTKPAVLAEFEKRSDSMAAERVERGSGNVFADLGVPDPGLALAKADLAARILLIIVREGFTQAAAGKRLGVGQPKVSALLGGRLEGFSTDRLVRFFTLLGCDVRISVSRPRLRGHGVVRVVES
jgi:predicted XRE-type DNA-binding protein